MLRTVQSVLALTLAFAMVLPPVGLAAVPEDPLAAAKAAYIATEYEEALRILSAPQPGPASDEADVYRALCLLALGRMNEVDQVLRSIVVRNPSFRLSEKDVTPRMIALFRDVRSRTLLSLVRDGYAQAKASYDAGRFAEASLRFREVIGLITREQSTLGEEGQAATDLKQLATGFKDLADAEVAKTAALEAAAARTATAPAAATPAAPAIVRDETVIAGVVERYALAFSALDAAAVTDVFPAENPAMLRSAFNRLRSQSIEARDVNIAVDPGGQSATVKLTWAVEAVPKVGSPIKAQRPTTLRLSKTAAGDWTIVGRR